MSFTKKLKRSNDLYIDFSEEELAALNIKSGDKFSCTTSEDCIILEKFASIDIDLSEYSRDSLEFLISESINKDISINEVFSEILTKSIEYCEKTLPSKK